MKKIIALTLCLAGVVAILCACNPKQPAVSSSAIAGAESSEIAFDETESKITSNKTSSIKDNKSSSDKDESSSRASSKREETTSVSTSESIKMSFTDPSLEIGAYHFNPLYTNNYADPEHFL